MKKHLVPKKQKPVHFLPIWRKGEVSRQFNLDLSQLIKCSAESTATLATLDHLASWRATNYLIEKISLAAGRSAPYAQPSLFSSIFCLSLGHISYLPGCLRQLESWFGAQLALSIPNFIVLKTAPHLSSVLRRWSLKAYCARDGDMQAACYYSC